ncbi:MAG: hypothetical protein QW341_03165 [Candidatus Bathyarchaeia archaeon]
MGLRAALLRISMLAVELTSLPLIMLASIYLLSGYQMLNPEIKAIPEPRKIHTDKFLRALTIFLAYLHTLGGVIIIAERRLKGNVKKTVELLASSLIILLLIIFLLVEATL